MKKALVFLLAAVLLCVSLTASAEKNKMTIEIDSGKYPVVAADDPCLDAFRAEGEKAAKNALPVIFLPLNRNRQLQAVVKPGSVQNKKFSLSVNALHNQNSRDSSYSFTLSWSSRSRGSRCPPRSRRSASGRQPR